MQVFPAAAPPAKPAAPDPAGMVSGRPRGPSFESVMAGSMRKIPDDSQATGDIPDRPQDITGMLFQKQRRPKPPDEEETAASADILTALFGQQPGIIPAIPDFTLPASGTRPESDTPNVIDILEGNSFNSEVSPLGLAQQGEAAPVAEDRMPGITARTPETLESERLAAAPAPGGEPCPLENDNDRALTAKDVKDSATRRPAPSAGSEATAETVRGDAAASALPAHGEAASDAGADTADSQSAPHKRAPAEADAPRADFHPMEMRAHSIVRGENAAPAQSEKVTATKQNLFDTMVKQMSADKSSVEIELKPDFLGKVSIRLSLDENGVQARIRADDPTVKSMINGQINQLIEALNDKGVRINTVDVVYTGAESMLQNPGEGGGARRDGAAAREQRGAGSRTQAVGAAGLFESALNIEPTSLLEPEISSVEYRA